MSTHTKSPSFPSRPEAGGQPDRSSQGGYAFLILMMVLTILLITMTTALPDIYTARQRESEEELIFRGNEYARAIMLYRRQFNRFPSSVDDLVKRTNGFRFLRHAYKDPMTKSGKWRFIHASAGGAVLDSKTLPSGQGINPPASPGGQKEGASKNQTADDSQPSDDSETPGKQKKNETAQGEEKEMQGAFIVGVASSSKKKSIRVWDNHDRYDEWEFLGVNNAPTGAVGAQPGTPADNQAQQPGAANPSTNPHATNPMRPM
jgi:type II secretory pathway pseudopilin PulG